MNPFELTGLALGIFGLLFAFEAPRSYFLKLFRLRRAASPVPFLQIPIEQATEIVDYCIAEGERIREEMRSSPPKSEKDLWSYSDRWHRWRRETESYLSTMFSTTEVLSRLKELRPQHQNHHLELPWEDRTAALAADIEHEVVFFRALRSRLPNYLRSRKSGVSAIK